MPREKRGGCSGKAKTPNMTTRQIQSLGLQIVFLLFVTSCSLAAQPWTLERGTLPVIIVSVHGGTKPLAKGELRQKTLSSDPHFTTKGDGRTANLAKAIAREIRRLHLEYAKPTLFVNHVHRRYLDLNRKSEWSSHHQIARDLHRAFHSALQSEIDRNIAEHGWVLLLDVHGQSKYTEDVLIGTYEQRSVSDWSISQLWGTHGLVKQLLAAGFQVNPESPQATQKYRGGYITQHYGQNPKVEAWQIEHGADLRFTLARRHLYVSILSKALNQALEFRPKTGTQDLIERL